MKFDPTIHHSAIPTYTCAGGYTVNGGDPAEADEIVRIYRKLIDHEYMQPFFMAILPQLTDDRQIEMVTDYLATGGTFRAGPGWLVQSDLVSRYGIIQAILEMILFKNKKNIWNTRPSVVEGYRKCLVFVQQTLRDSQK